MKIGNIRLVRGRTVEEIDLENRLELAKRAHARELKDLGMWADVLAPARAGVKGKAFHLPKARKEEIVRAFRRVEATHPLLLSFLDLIDVRLEQVRAQGSAVEMADHPGQLAHAAGGACWLETLRDDVQRAFAEAHGEKAERGKAEG